MQIYSCNGCFYIKASEEHALIISASTLPTYEPTIAAAILLLQQTLGLNREGELPHSGSQQQVHSAPSRAEHARSVGKVGAITEYATPGKR